MKRFEHTNRPGFWLGFIDFFTAGLFFLIYMPMGLQNEFESILGHKVRPYWQAYLLGIPDLFIYPLVSKAEELGIEGPHTSWKHMFWWNLLGCLCFGPMIATGRFFKTLNQIETELNKSIPEGE